MMQASEYPQVPPAPGDLTGGGDQAGADGRQAGLSGTPARLHPAVMVIWPLAQIGPLLLLLVAGALSPIVAGVLLVSSAAASAVRYARFTWRVDDDALVIEQGLLLRQRRVIPLERIQSVDLARKVRHRAFGVVEVRVEAVGGGTTEGRLDALSVPDGQRLRALLLRERDRVAGSAAAAGGPSAARAVGAPSAAPAASGAAEGALLARLGPDRLVVAGLTGGRVGVAAALLGFLQQVFAERLDELLEAAPALLGLRGIVAVVVIAVVGAFVLSIVATVVAYWDFTLTREGPSLRVRRGLLEQRSDTLPLRRVQAVRVEENLIRRLLGFAAVKVDVAGRSGGEGRDTGILLPLGRRSEAFALAQRVLDVDGIAELDLAPMPARARNRRLVRAVVGVVVLTVPAVVVFDATGLLAALLLAPAVGAAIGSYRALGHAEAEGFVVARSGLLVRRTAFVPKARLQSLALTATPLQRLRGLATLDLQIARSPGVWSGPQLIDLDAGAGSELLRDLAGAVVSGRTALPPALAGRTAP
ncbi:MAG TPA: PH domain-containing protein [Egibacteraceae bacterium]|nr:PH domain-containing protein [Egibacteraceae bacterium]